MTHKIGNYDYNLNCVIYISGILELDDKKYFILYFVNGFDLRVSNKRGDFDLKNAFVVPDPEGERLIIIGKMNQK